MRRSGFTLFEILIALMVVVILVSTMSGTIGVAFKSQDRAERIIDGVRDIQTMGDVWISDVECAVPPNVMAAGYNSDAYQVAATLAYVAETQAEANSDSTTGGVTMTGGINGMNNGAGISAGQSYLFGPFKGDNISMSFYTTGPEPKAAIQGDVRYVEFGLTTLTDNTMALVRRMVRIFWRRSRTRNCRRKFW